MRRIRSAALALAVSSFVAVTATGCVGSTSSSGSCAVKTIELDDAHLVPGGQVALSVDWMTATCEDTGGANSPASNIAVTITPATTEHEYRLGTIATVSAPDYTASGTFDLPADLPSGDATLTVSSPVGDYASATRDVVISAR